MDDILIIRLSSLGDIIHTLPAFAALRRNFPKARIHWAVERKGKDILDFVPGIDEIVVVGSPGWRKALRNPGRTVFDFQGLLKSALIARAAGAPVVGFCAGARREPTSAILGHRPVQPIAGRHVVDQNLALAEAAGLPVFERRPDARFLLGRPSLPAREFLEGQARPFALYHPGARRPEKTWGEERFARLGDLLESGSGLAPVVSWGPGDESRARRLAALLPGARLLPLLELTALAHVMAAASLVVAGDTGPLHLADAVGARTLALFGPTDPDRNGPYGQPGSVVRYDSKTSAEEVAGKAIEVLAA